MTVSLRGLLCENFLWFSKLSADSTCKFTALLAVSWVGEVVKVEWIPHDSDKSRQVTSMAVQALLLREFMPTLLVVGCPEPLWMLTMHKFR